MLFTRSLTAAAAALSLIASATASYNPTSKANVATYWGAGFNQTRLRHFCDSTSVDIIMLSFVNRFPAQGNGLPGTDFGNACWGDPVYPGSGGDPADNFLPERCLDLQDDIPYCQNVVGKKIILSLGGEVPEGTTATYALSGEQNGIDFANLLWGMYGPYKKSWKGLRPLDRSSTNTSTDAFYQIDIDGFDFDIEAVSADNQAGYIAMIKQLQMLFQTNPCKTYLITGSPQCIVADGNMGTMIQQAPFDILWVQFYNTPQCSARTWVTGNDNAFNVTHPVAPQKAGFTYDDWVYQLSLGASKNAQVYLGLLGGPSGGAAGDFLWPQEAEELIATYSSHSKFGGVMLWEATVADNTLVKNSAGSTVTYYDFIKDTLNPYKPLQPYTLTLAPTCPTLPTGTSTSTTSQTSTSTPVTTTSTTTTTSSSTSSTSSSTTSSTLTPTSTSSSSSTSQTSTSCTSSSTTSSSTSSSSTESSSSTSTTSSSSTSSSPSSSSSTSSTTSSSSSSSSPSSTSPTSTATSSTSPTSSASSTSCTETTGSSTSAESTSSPTSSTSSSSVVSSSSSTSCTETTGSSTSTSAESTSSPTSSTSSSSVVSSSSSTSSTETGGSSTSTSAGTTSSSTSSSTSAVSSTSSSSSASGTTSESSSTGSSTSTSAGTTSVPTTSTVSSTSAPTSSPTLSSSTTSGSLSSSASVSPSSSVVSSSSSVETIPTSSGTPTSSGVSSTPSSTSTSGGIVSSPSSSVVSSTTGVLTTPISSGTSQSGGVVTTPSSSPVYTTSTVYTTTEYTITSCAPTVTNCPAKIGSVTTETIALYTTVCPVTETEGSGGVTKPTSTPVAPPPMTTSTVYTTKIYTITSCAPTVTNCPAKLGQVTTEVISLYTTVCPVAEATSTPVASPSLPGGVLQQLSSSASVKKSSSESTTTLSSTFTTYKTIKVILSTATVVPTPLAPFPTGSPSSSGIASTGTGVGSTLVSSQYVKPVPSTAGGEVATATPTGVVSATTVGVVSATPTPSTFQGAGTRVGSSMVAIVVGVFVALMIV